jgi:hypothetical protein
MGTDRRITGFGDGVGEDFAVTDEQVDVDTFKVVTTFPFSK